MWCINTSFGNVSQIIAPYQLYPFVQIFFVPRRSKAKVMPSSISRPARILASGFSDAKERRWSMRVSDSRNSPPVAIELQARPDSTLMSVIYPNACHTADLWNVLCLQHLSSICGDGAERAEFSWNRAQSVVERVGPVRGNTEKGNVHRLGGQCSNSVWAAEGQVYNTIHVGVYYFAGASPCVRVYSEREVQSPAGEPCNGRVRSIVPNVGGFAGVSFQLHQCQSQLGLSRRFLLRCDGYGFDTAKQSTIGFYGPFATSASDFRNGPLGVKAPSDNLVAGIRLPFVVSTWPHRMRSDGGREPISETC